VEYAAMNFVVRLGRFKSLKDVDHFGGNVDSIHIKTILNWKNISSCTLKVALELYVLLDQNMAVNAFQP
jgi:hypothetical protein